MRRSYLSLQFSKVWANLPFYWKSTGTGHTACQSSVFYSSCFLLGFLGFLDRLFALQSGHMGAFRWICWWHDKHAWNAIAASCYKHQSGAGTRVIEYHTLKLQYRQKQRSLLLKEMWCYILYNLGMWTVISGQLKNRSISLNKTTFLQTCGSYTYQ